MKNENIHPIYLHSFVGTWKRATTNDEPGDGAGVLTFTRDYKYEETIGSGGTVNGDVDEVSVGGDGVPDTQKSIWGAIGLSQGPQRYQWHYTLEHNSDIHVTDLSNADELPGSPRYNQLTLSAKSVKKRFILQSASPKLKSGKEGKVALNS